MHPSAGGPWYRATTSFTLVKQPCLNHDNITAHPEISCCPNHTIQSPSPRSGLFEAALSFDLCYSSRFTPPTSISGPPPHTTLIRSCKGSLTDCGGARRRGGARHHGGARRRAHAHAGAVNCRGSWTGNLACAVSVNRVCAEESASAGEAASVCPPHAASPNPSSAQTTCLQARVDEAVRSLVKT